MKIFNEGNEGIVMSFSRQQQRAQALTLAEDALLEERLSASRKSAECWVLSPEKHKR
jgi:hypothetical protein